MLIAVIQMVASTLIPGLLPIARGETAHRERAKGCLAIDMRQPSPQNPLSAESATTDKCGLADASACAA